MNNHPVETKKFRVRLAPFVLAAICFVLPFVHISCSAQKEGGMSLTGLQLALGTDIKQQNPMTGQTVNQKVRPEGHVQLALLCALAGIGLCFVKTRMGKGLPAAAGALGFIFMLLARGALFESTAKEGQGMLSIDLKAGFLLALLAFLAGAIIAGLQFLKSKEVAPDGAWAPPTAPGSEISASSSSAGRPTGESQATPQPATAVPRAPMSPGAKKAIAAIVVVAILAVVAHFALNRLHRFPSQDEISQFVKQHINIPGQQVSSVTSQPVVAGASATSAGLDIIGEWHGRAPDGTSVGYVFKKDNTVTWQLAGMNLEGKYSLHQGTPYWEIDIQNLKSASSGTPVPPEVTAMVFHGLIAPEPPNTFKMDGLPSSEGPRPKALGPNTAVFNKAGTSGNSIPQKNIPAPPEGGVQLDFVVTMEMTEPLYAKVAADQLMQQQGADPSVFRKIQEITAGPNHARIIEIAGVTVPVEDFKNKVIVRETTSKGHQYTSSGKINAVRQDGKWQFTIVSGPAPDKDAPVGYALANFGGNVLSTNQPDQSKKIQDTITQAGVTLQKLQDAREQYRTETAAAQKAAQAAAQEAARQKRADDDAKRAAQNVAARTPAAPATAVASSTPAVAVNTPAAPAITALPAGTAVVVTLSDTFDSSSLQSSYRGTVWKAVALGGGVSLEKGSPVTLAVTQNGNAYQINLSNVTLNGSSLPVTSENLDLGSVPGSGPVVNNSGGTIRLAPLGNLFRSKSLVVKSGKQFTFHQQ